MSISLTFIYLYAHCFSPGALKRLLLNSFLHTTKNTLQISTRIFSRLSLLFFVGIFSLLRAQADHQSLIITSGTAAIIGANEIYPVTASQKSIQTNENAQRGTDRKAAVSKSLIKQDKPEAKRNRRLQKSKSKSPSRARLPESNSFVFNQNPHGGTAFSTGKLYSVVAVLNNLPSAKAITVTLCTIFLVFFFYSRGSLRKNRVTDSPFFLCTIKVRPPPF